MTLSDFPRKYDTETDAIDDAVRYSSHDKNNIYYVIFSNTGNYILDVMIGQAYSDEKILYRYYQGKVAA